MHAYNYVHALYNDYFVCSLLTILASMSQMDISVDWVSMRFHYSVSVLYALLVAESSVAARYE